MKHILGGQGHEAVGKEMEAPREIGYWAQQPETSEKGGQTALKPVEGE